MEEQKDLEDAPTQQRVLIVGYLNFFAGFDKAKLPLIIVNRIKEYTGASDFVFIPATDTNIMHDLIMVGPYNKSLMPNVNKFKSRVRLMFACEELTRLGINDQLVKQHSDFAIGYVKDSGLTSVHLPNWYFYWDFLEGQKIEEPTNKKSIERKKRACFIARMSHGNTRPMMVKSLQTVIPTDCPGKICNNMPSVEQITGIHGDGNRAKNTFIKDYIFNLCPENASIPGYVTEKIMQAVMAGCIPIYWGHPDVESNVLNKNRILWCQSKSSIGATTLNQIRELLQDEQKLSDFMEQPIFLEDAQQHIDAVNKRFDECIRAIASKITQ